MYEKDILEMICVFMTEKTKHRAECKRADIVRSGGTQFVQQIKHIPVLKIGEK